jgi:hypothetical protein
MTSLSSIRVGWMIHGGKFESYKMYELLIEKKKCMNDEFIHGNKFQTLEFGKMYGACFGR